MSGHDPEDIGEKLKNRGGNIHLAQARIRRLGYMMDIRLSHEQEKDDNTDHLAEDVYYLIGNNHSRIIFTPWGLDPEVRVQIRDNINKPWQEVLRMEAGEFANAPLMQEIASDISDNMRKLAVKMNSTERKKDGAWFSLELPAKKDYEQGISLVTEDRLYHLKLEMRAGTRGRLTYKDRWSLDLSDKDAVENFHFSDIVKADAAYEAKLEEERKNMRREFEEMSRPGPVEKWVRKQVDRVRKRLGRKNTPKP